MRPLAVPIANSLTILLDHIGYILSLRSGEQVLVAIWVAAWSIVAMMQDARLVLLRLAVCQDPGDPMRAGAM